jgi:hypothetical protein
MSRHLEPIADQSSVALLAQLTDRDTDASRYRAAMYALGVNLGKVVAGTATSHQPRIMVVCTVEDADFLARGVIEAVAVIAKDLRLTCFWNTKVVPFENDDFQITPITRRYEEPNGKKIDWLIIVKSIISGSCVVKTNLMEAIDHSNPGRIFIVAPVMHVDSERKLRAEFSRNINEKFSFVVFARDDERAKDGEIRPGIGGEVYSRLGFVGRDDKNGYTPDLIKERRKFARSLAIAAELQ